MMRKTFDRFFNWIDRVAEVSGRIFCYVVFIMMLITAADVTARYVFNYPLVWGWLLNRLLFGVFILFAGVIAEMFAHIKDLRLLMGCLPPLH
ncbi:MAG: hypothetical protein P8Y38_05135 [Deltaproteobacteria bacterium]